MALLDFYSGGPAATDSIDLSVLSQFAHRSFASNFFRWFDDADNEVVLFGTGITFTRTGSTLPDVTGGRVTGLGLEQDGSVVWLFSGLDLDAAALFQRLVAGDQDAVRAMLLSGDDRIGGTSGNDTLRGGRGNDALFGQDGDDRLSGSIGNDTVAGGAGDDALSGGAGDDVLQGQAGSDRMLGGEGADRFVFSQITLGSEVDHVLDFAPGEDLLVLNRADLPGLGASGTLEAARFHDGAAAETNQQRILWDGARGELWYDSDGARSAAAVLIARLTPGLDLTATDFEVYYSALPG